MSSSKDCHHFKKEKDIQKLKTERNITYPEARRLFSSVSNPSSSVMSYASVTKRVCVTSETQTMITWPIDQKDPTRLPAQTTDKIITSSRKTSASQTSTPSASTTSSTPSQSSTNSSSNQKKNSQNNNSNVNSSNSNKNSNQKGDRTPKLLRDPIKVHNRFGSLDHLDTTIWGDPMDTLPPDTGSKSRSPSRNRRNSPKKSVNYSPIRKP